ncbi:MAG: HAD family hydrolase [Holophagaceae bacterium]|nr:HAD family hydrolase [Holophagaceae bacterium]
MDKRPAIFIDRDGTLNLEVGYLHRPEDVIITPGAAGWIACLNKKNIPSIVITNQSGIGRGSFCWNDYYAVTKKIDELLAKENALLDDQYACPFHKDGIGKYRHPNHPDRKPNPGMLLKAAKKHCIDLERSWMIGDKEIDLEAARNAGCRSALVLTGYGRSVNPQLADIVADDLGKAIERILSIGL